MKNKCSVSLFTAICVLALGLSAASASTTNNVFAVTLTASGTAQDLVTTTTIKAKATSATIINLALGQEIAAAVPTNQVLAFVIDSSLNTGDLVVFDTSAATVIATVASEFDTAAITSAKSTQFMALLDFNTVGNIDSGEMMLTGTFTPTMKAPFVKLTATAAAFLHIRLGGDAVDVVLPKGSVKLGAQVGQLVP